MCEINELKRGNIHWVKDHFYNENDEIEKEDTYHPYLIISSDRNNSGNSSNVTVLMLSTQLSSVTIPTHIMLNGYKNLKPSLVKAESIQTIPKSFVGARICSIRKGDLMNVERGLALALQLPFEDEE